MLKKIDNLTNNHSHVNPLKLMSSYFRKEIEALKGYHLSAYPDVIKLNQNEMPYDIPTEIKAKVLEKIVRTHWNRYPLAQPLTLRNKLAQNLNWPEEGILLSNGSNVLIQAIILATSVQGRILTLDPTFSLYELEGKVLGNEVDLVPLEENFSFPVKAILQQIAENSPRAIFIANPNAPTGNLFSKEEILEVVKAAPCLVVIDEAYSQFADYNLLDEVPNYKNLVLLRTFSKAFGLGAGRMGFALAAPEVAQEIAKVLLPYCVSGITELMAEAILDHPEVVEKHVTKIKIGRAWLYQTLSGLQGIKVYPSQTNFLVFQVDDAAKIFQGLLDQKVLVRDVSHPQALPNTLRVSVGTSEENEKFVKALEKLL